MSFLREIIRDKPLAVFPISSLPITDYSGYEVGVNVSGTAPSPHPSLVAGESLSHVFSSDTLATFNSPVLHQGREPMSFTLEAWVRGMHAYTSTDEQTIVGNQAVGDGLLISGTVVSFGLKYSTAPEVRVSYDLQQLRSVHLVGVKVEDKISLFVNSVLVGEATIGEEQQADTYVSTATTLCIGNGGTSKAALSSVAIYPSALDQTAVSRHYAAGSTTPSGGDVATAFKGERIPVSLEVASLFMDQWWSTAADWEAAQLFNTAVIKDQLRPQVDGTVSLSGQWLDSVALDSEEGTAVHGLSLNWDGVGATIEVSLDGITWEQASRGVSVNMIAPGFNPTDKELQVRISFAGGIENDTSYVDNLNVVGIKTAVTPSVAGREITYSSAHPEREYRPLEFHDNWGAEISSSGSIVVSADTSDDAIPVRTIEMWIKRIGVNPTISVTGTAYQQGQSSTTTLPTGEWTLLHIISATDVTGNITITGPAQLGHVAIYDRALTATEIQSVYGQYVKASSFRVEGETAVSITKPGAAAKVYAHDWSILLSG